MIRKIITINKDACIGCGLCVNACMQGAIQLVDGKATLLRDDYCDGLGMCLPACPVKAITFEEREAMPYDINEAPKMKEKAKKETFVCPSTAHKTIDKSNDVPNSDVKIFSELKNWPVQIQLVPIKANFYENADLLISADCVAFSYGNFHSEFIKNKVTVIGCPKLDNVDYQNKLTEIFTNNNIKSITVAKMEVPCCNGILNMTKNAILNSGNDIPLNVVTISVDGKIK